MDSGANHIFNKGSAEIRFIAYGKVGLAEAGKGGGFLDGEKVGVADLFNAGVKNEQVLLGTQTVTKGGHILKVECTGTSGNGYFFGLNYLEFVTAEEENPGTSIEDIKYTGSNGLLAVLKEYTSAEAPHDQGIGGLTDTSDDGSHLFWRSATGVEATFEISLEHGGDYDIELGHTCAGDFGKFDLYIDGVRIAEGIDGWNGAVVVKKELIEAVALTAGSHTMTIKCVGKNASSVGTYIGIDYITFSTQVAGGGDNEQIEDDSGIFAAEKETAKEELKTYAENAYESADEYQTAKIRRAVSVAKVEFCQAATLEELAELLKGAKKKIDTILTTEYDGCS